MDYLEISFKVFITFMILFFALVLFGLFMLIVDEYKWTKIKPIEIEAVMVSRSYGEDTLNTSTVPIFNSNGSVGIGIATSGKSESYTTIWDLGDFGIVK